MPARTGLFGKLPAHGDFVRRNLPRSFVGPWDAWLSAGLLAAPDARWGPWRFHLAAGACGPDAAAGVLAPSGDAVGRRFPLTLAALGVPHRPPEAWYAALEVLAADATLDADTLAAALPAPPAASCLPRSASDDTVKLRPESAQSHAPDSTQRGACNGEDGGVRDDAPNGLPDAAPHGLLWTADGRHGRLEAGFAALLPA